MAAIILPLIIEGPATGNTGVGSSALLFNNGGISNTAFGLGTLKLNQNGDGNTAIGSNAMLYNTTGDDNTGVGKNALSANSTGLSNTAIGSEALSAATGNLNTAIGKDAGILITTGQKNTVLGPFSGNQGGYDIRTLSNYVVIADGDGNPRIIVDPAGLVSAPGGFSGGGGGGGAITINNKTAAYTVVSGDLGEIINCTAGTFTVSLTAAATLGSGFNCWIWNTSTTAADTITIDPSGAETIDGRTTLILRRGEGTQIVCDGTNWQTGDKKTMRGYAENIPTSYARPVASASGSVAIGGISQATGTDSMSLGYNSAATASGAMGLGFDSQASQIYSSAIGANSAGSGARSIGTGSTSIGGSYASGTDSFAAAIANNTVTYGARATGAIAMGDRNQATNGNSTCVGGQLSTAGGGASLVSGAGCSTGTNSFGSVAVGNGATNTVAGKFSFAGTYYSSTFGTSQMGMICLSNTTPGAAATVLTSNGGAASTINQLILPDNTAHAFSGIVVARQKSTGGTQSAAWSVSGLIRREAGAGTTTLVASTVTVISNVPGWTLALSADTVNGGLSVTATGAAATDIRWHVKLDSSEVTYT